MNTKTAAASKPVSKKGRAPVAKKPADKPFSDRGEREPDAEPVPETAVQLIPLQLLGRAPENVRHTRSNEDILELADDIGAHGLLQSLIGYQDPDQDIFPTGYTWIVGGGRRLQALELLRDRGAIGDEYRVPVLVRGMDEAVELSLSENLARRDMSPADEFEAFALLMKPGNVSPEDLAKRFGFSPRYVRQRLRLGDLHEDILEALRDRKLTIDAAMAYAKSQDKSLQGRVFREQAKSNWKPHDPTSISQAYINVQLNTGSALFQFVGAEMYEADGGGYEDDLFGAIGENDHRKLTDVAKVQRLAREKAEAQLPGLLAGIQEQYPTVTQILLCPGTIGASTYGGKMPKAPDGYTATERVWNGPNDAEMWDMATKAGIPIVGVAGIRGAGVLTLEEKFFVPKDRLREVCPKTEYTPYVPPTPEERAAERRKDAAQLIAARMALPRLSDLPGFEGRVFISPHARLHEAQHPATDTKAFYYSVDIYVSPDEVRSNLASAFVEYDKRLAQQNETAAARAAEREIAEQAKADALEARAAEILAMDPPPAVVYADGLAFFRLQDGSYADAREEEDDNRLYLSDDLGQLLEEASEIGRVYATVEEYDADPHGDNDLSAVEAEVAS